ncbi:MAG: helix-turn-helix domain-containing protein [Magnetococcales bacterium]|nr:helix-turn-helix domain-containing protein [Magnetococcales bacterium]
MVAKIITPLQCKLGRTALGWGVRDLANAAEMSTQTISRFERGEELKPRTIKTIQGVLEAAGIQFIPENGGGAGVRLKERAEG